MISAEQRAHRAHTLALLYRDRGQVDEALAMGAGAALLGDETIDAMYAQLALASPSITDSELHARQAAWASTYARAGEIAPDVDLELLLEMISSVYLRNYRTAWHAGLTREQAYAPLKRI